MTFSAVAELGVGEAPGAIFSMSCASAVFSVAGQGTSVGAQAGPASFALFGNAAVLRLQLDSIQPTLTGAVAEFAVAEGPPVEGLTLSAQAGVFGLSAQSAAGALAAPSEPAAFSLVGGAAQIGWPLTTAAFALSGQGVAGAFLGTSGAAAFDLTGGSAQIGWPVSGAAFALSAEAATSSVRMTSAAASYSLFGGNVAVNISFDSLPPSGTGAVAEFAVAEFDPIQRFGLYAAPAAFGVFGQATAGRVNVPAALAIFSLAGGDAHIRWPHDPAAFSFMGQMALFRTILPAGQSSFALTGGDAGIIWPHDTAAFTLAAQPIRADIRMPASGSGFLLAGQDSLYFAGARMYPEPAAFALAGQDALFSIREALAAGQFAFTGSAANLLRVFTLFADPAPFTAAGQNVGWSYALGGERADFALSSPPTPLARLMPAAGAAFAMSGQAALFSLRFRLDTAHFTVLGWAVTDAVGPRGDHIFLIEVQAHDGASLQNFYMATSGWTSAPSDSPPNQFYEPRVIEPGNFERMLFSSGETRGRSSVGAGDIILANSDPGDGTTLDAWLDYGWDGRSIAIKALPVGAKSLAAASTLFRGRLSKLTTTRPLDTLSLQIADRLSDLDKPLLTTLFAGTTTSAGATAEGNADLKGKVKQRVYGEAFEVPLQPANPYDLIYLASDKGFAAITVYDGGVPLTGDGDNADITALRAASISPGHYRTCKAAGLVRLGGMPVYTLSADIVEGVTSADRTAAQVARRMLTDFGIAPNEIITGAFSALDGKNSAVVGMHIDTDRAALDAISEVLDSVGGWLVPSRDGSFEVNRFEEPAPGPALTFDLESQAIGESLDRIDSPIPVYRVTLKYRRIEMVQNESQLAGSVSAERRAYLSSEWRTVVAEDAAVKTKHLNARELTIETCLTTEAAAQAEANRLLALYKVGRARYEVEVPLSDGWAGDVGLALTLVHPTRLNMAGGKAFNIVRRVDDYSKEAVRFEVWG